MKKPLSPFHGDPKTIQTVDENGGIKFIIKAIYITPEIFFISKILAKITILPLAALFTIGAYQRRHEIEIWFFLLIVLILHQSYIGAKEIWQDILSKRKTFEVTKEFITVKGFFEDQIFSRTQPHKFSIIPHDKTQQENDKFEVNRSKKRKRLYSASYHLSLDCIGQRNDLITIYEHKNAMAIASRLTACCEVASASTGLTGGTPISPEQQWDNGNTGDIE